MLISSYSMFYLLSNQMANVLFFREQGNLESLYANTEKVYFCLLKI